MTITLSCPICSSSKATSLYRVKNADMVECHDCGMVYVPSPAPEVTTVYKDSYFNNDPSGRGYVNYRAEFENHLLTFNDRLTEAEAMLGSVGRILDVGCALGHLGEAAKRRGWDVYVADVAEYAVEEARKSFGLNGFVLGHDKLPVFPGRFDLLTMYDVVEHLSHPLDLLREARKALSLHGYLHLTTPDAASFSAKIMGAKWYHIKPDEHLLYFTPQTMRLALEKSGFEVVKIKPASRVMRVEDILLRVERYSPFLSKLLRGLTKLVGLAEVRFKIPTGEMQVWARPAGPRPLEKAVPAPVKDLLDIVCCPNCRSEIQLFEDVEALCTQCELSFEVQNGVINFSKYGKRSKGKLVGSS